MRQPKTQSPDSWGSQHTSKTGNISKHRKRVTFAPQPRHHSPDRRASIEIPTSSSSPPAKRRGSALRNMLTSEKRNSIEIPSFPAKRRGSLLKNMLNIKCGLNPIQHLSETLQQVNTQVLGADDGAAQGELEGAKKGKRHTRPHTTHLKAQKQLLNAQRRRYEFECVITKNKTAFHHQIINVVLLSGIHDTNSIYPMAASRC